MDECNYKPIKTFFTGMLIGAAAGALAGILFAPKSGKETREEIAKYAREIRKTLSKELERAGDYTKETYRSIVDKVVGMYQEAKKISKEQAEGMKKDLKEGYEEAEKILSKKR